MFKAMLAAAGGTEKGAPVAKLPAKPSVTKSPTTAGKKSVESAPAPNTKPRTFTQAKGHDFTVTKPVTKTPVKPAPKPKAPSSSRPGTGVKSASKQAPKTVTRSTKPVGRKPPVRPEYKEPAPSAKPKRLNFMEIMNKAKDVSGDKLKMDMKTLTREEREKQMKERKKATPTPPPPSNHNTAPAKRSPLKSKPTAHVPSQRKSSELLGPAPTAKPSAELLAKLKRRRQEADEEDSELEDFVVDDEEQEYGGSGYQSQIWEALGRKPRQQYFDDDSDDMEATGADLFDEEERSARLARREDLEEEKKLQALAEAKAMRKRMKQR